LLDRKNDNQHPIYLLKHYWWAYLWKPSVKFFDHQLIVNLILFGQYKKLMRETLDCLAKTSSEKVLQLTCVYGVLTEKIMQLIKPQILHLTDVSMLQLELTRKKVSEEKRLNITQMNVERTAYKSDTFSSTILFFLLHEMPREARERTLSETIRITKKGGHIVCTEYAPEPKKHWLHRFPVSRYCFERLEPFLGDFWQTDVTQTLTDLAEKQNKGIKVVSDKLFFLGFYRVTLYQIVEK